MARYGRVDVVVNNASALWWQDIEDTPTKKYDLIQGVNARGAFVLTRACMREMRAGAGRRTGDLDGTAAAEGAIRSTRRRRRITCPSAG